MADTDGPIYITFSEKTREISTLTGTELKACLKSYKENGFKVNITGPKDYLYQTLKVFIV